MNKIFISVFIFIAFGVRFKKLKFEFVEFRWGRITDKLVIYWQNFSQIDSGSSLFLEYGGTQGCSQSDPEGLISIKMLPRTPKN